MRRGICTVADRAASCGGGKPAASLRAGGTGVTVRWEVHRATARTDRKGAAVRRVGPPLPLGRHRAEGARAGAARGIVPLAALPRHPPHEHTDGRYGYLATKCILL